MRTVELGMTGTLVPNVTLGLMRIHDKTDEQIRDLYAAARESGIDFFDHADIYGPKYHECEQRFADALNLSPSERDEIVIQTKAGIVKPEPGETGPHFDFSYDHIVAAADNSLKALKTDRIDILLLHRPDTFVEPEEVARAFDHLESEGKVLHFGVSNHQPGQVDLLKTAVRQPLVANQLQLSIPVSRLVGQGLAANMPHLDQSVLLDGEVLPYSRINKMTIQAWSPFQGGFFTGPFIDNPEFAELNQVMGSLGEEYGVTKEAIATSWITSHPAQMQVVLGTTTPQRVRDAAAGSEIKLSRSQWYELFRAAGHTVP